MIFVIPVGQEQSEVRRFPWLTALLVVPLFFPF